LTISPGFSTTFVAASFAVFLSSAADFSGEGFSSLPGFPLGDALALA
jgi:hypothetical protein